MERQVESPNDDDFSHADEHGDEECHGQPVNVVKVFPEHPADEGEVAVEDGDVEGAADPEGDGEEVGEEVVPDLSTGVILTCRKLN